VPAVSPVRSSYQFDMPDAAASNQQMKLNAETSTGLTTFVNYVNYRVM